MQAKKNIVSSLNDVLTTELTSINHYFLHARMYKNWGFDALNDYSYKKSIKDMKQADELIERILFLEGLPNLQKLDALEIGEDVTEMLSCDLSFQTRAIAQLKDTIAFLEKEQDYVSRSMLEERLSAEEDYLDWVETQHYQIKAVTLENYLQTQISDD